MVSTALEPTGAQLARINAMVREAFGFDLATEREAVLKSALKRRMACLGQACYDAYHAVLLTDPQEANRLAELLTVNETYFFREPEQLRLAIDQLLPEIMKARPGPYRILSAGCSSGEEAYSVAIMLKERYGPDSERLFAVAGVDLDEAVIRSARTGVFGRHSFRGVDPQVLDRHFHPHGAHAFKLRAGAGPAVAFEAANLLGTFPPIMHRPDLILYRNVSIYFQEPLQRRIFQRLADLLPLGGYLVVGATETFHHDLGILALVERDGLFVFRKQPDFSLVDRRSARREAASVQRPAPRTPGPASPAPPARLAAAVRKAPTSAQLFDDALLLARSGRGREALVLLDGLVREAPAFVKAHSLTAAILLGESRFPESRQACLKALELDPLTLEACLMLGVIARNEGDNLAAQQRFREAVYLDGACWMAHFYLAEILAQSGEARRASSGFEAVLRILADPALRDRCLFPLAYKAEPFMAICRHKLSLLGKNG
jgi:chemotaxis protein methyltransferase CheR